MNWNSRLQGVRVPAWAPKAAACGIFVLALSAVGIACITVQNGSQKPEILDQNRGYKFSHTLHVEQGLTDCSVCHEMDTETPGILTTPGHDLCSVCHEIPESGMEPPEDLAEREKCAFCHVREDYSVDEWTSVMHADVKWTHAPHVAAEIACTECHGELDQGRRPMPPYKPLCMDCHEKRDPALNACSVCHSEINTDTVPLFRGQQRIAHDSREVWEQIHGREARLDPMYCAMCHEEQASCDDCHSRVAPRDHTLSWRRRTHGMMASWDRNRCATCHEEDSCLQCHQETRPTSHHGGWGEPLNSHCVNCHYPPDRNNCTVCHEDISHDSAMPSPHNLGLFPPNCATCHPGGLPHQAPHAINSTVHCVECHQ